MADLAILDVADRPLGGRPAGGPAAGRDRAGARPRRARVPVRRAELRADPGGVDGPLPADAPARRRRRRRPPGLATGSPSSPSTPTASPSSSTASAPTVLRGRRADPGGDRGRPGHRPGRPGARGADRRPPRRRRRDGAAPHATGRTAGASSTGIDLHVRAGEIVAIVGVEGSGARELVRSDRRVRDEARATSRSRGGPAASAVAVGDQPRLRGPAGQPVHAT